MTSEEQNRVHDRPVANRRGVVIVFCAGILDARLFSLHPSSCRGRDRSSDLECMHNSARRAFTFALTCASAWHRFPPSRNMRYMLDLQLPLALLLTLDFGLCRFTTAIGTGVGPRSHVAPGSRVQAQVSLQRIVMNHGLRSPILSTFSVLPSPLCMFLPRRLWSSLQCAQSAWVVPGIPKSY